MSWTHRMCGECWLEKKLIFHENGDIEFTPPVQVKGVEPAQCCFCGQTTRMGIFVRHNPKNLNCDHKEDNNGD